MSKYIVDTDDFEPMFKVDSIGVFGIGKSLSDGTKDHSWSRIKSVIDFEELNSDYINEHFGQLQDEAYRRGVNDGSIDVKERVDCAYQRGLDDAWEAARKIVEMWEKIDNDDLLAIFGITEMIGHSAIKSLFGKQTANEAMLELEVYEEKQKADDEIKAGDEVRWGMDLIVVTRLHMDGGFKWCDGISKDGIAFHVLEENVSKTGRHFDIASILEEMRHD